ncbi:uncharacterized protein LOC108623770 isoform X2 [Ceratina calcarata]|nr:uncharacterized protein LOC108623770 isoform X2 [Ceratina calcarata]
MKQLGLKQSDLHNDTVVCSIHFKTEDFDKTSLTRIRLQPNAVPFIQVPEERSKVQNADLFNDHSYSRLHPERDLNDNADARHSEQNLKDNPGTEHSEQNVKDYFDVERLEKIQKLERSTDNARSIQEQDIKVESDAEHLLEIPKVEVQTSACTFSENDKGVQVNVAREDKATRISPERLFHTPEKDQLREHIARMKKDHQNQLRVWKQKCKRSNRRIEDLKAIVRFNKEQFIRSRTNPRQE